MLKAKTRKNGLEKKNAIVNYGECYIRKYIDIDLNQLKDNLINYHFKFILFSSTNSANHFLNQLKNTERSWLKNTKIIVNHKKIQDQLSIFFKNIFVCEDIGTQKLKELIFSESFD